MSNLITVNGVDISTAVDTETIKAQITENIKLGLENIISLPEFREQMPIAIVGGGPSLKDTIEELRVFNGPVIACGSVHDFLVRNKIKFQYSVLCDPDPLITEYIKFPQTDTKYLIASQCNPSVFKYLFNNKSYIWHAGGDSFDSIHFGEGEHTFGGGCTVGTRSIIIAMSFGYSNLHLFGFDSCLTKNYKHHSYEFETEDETVGNIHEIRLGGPESPVFRCAGYMVAQIFDFKKLLQMYNTRMNVTVHGEGALKYLMDHGKKLYNLQKGA